MCIWLFSVLCCDSVQDITAQACDLFANGRHPLTLATYVIDRYGRHSNIIRRTINIVTATFVFSNEKPVKITNQQSYISVVLNQKLDMAYYGKLVNITVTDALNG